MAATISRHEGARWVVPEQRAAPPPGRLRHHQPLLSLAALSGVCGRLGATFVHIDCGRNAFDWSAEAAAEVLRELVELGQLAQPSMFQFSGRGLWAFWLLRDEEDPSTTPFANADNRELWMSLQQRTADIIATELPGLSLDRPAGELTRVTRLHGSVNPAADRPVHYELLLSPAGEPIRYSLEELADFLRFAPFRRIRGGAARFGA